MRRAIWVLAALIAAPSAGGGDPVVAPRDPPVATAPDGASCHLVVMLSPARSPESPALARDRLANRAAGLGARLVRGLADDRPRPEPAARGHVAIAPGRSRAQDAAGAPPNPFDLDPERVFLLAAEDPGSARAAAEALAADPGVEWVEPTLEREACTFPTDGSPPDDPLYRDTRQWGLRNAGPSGVFGGLSGADVGAAEAWRMSCGSNQVLLALADTGIDPGHPDLTRTLPDGTARIAIGRNLTFEPADAWADTNGHGTAVAGVMAALTDDGAHFDSLGVAGLCGGDGRDNAGCQLAVFKIAPGHSGAASSFDIARAIVSAADAGARALNLSFAGDGESRVERLALYYALTRGCVVVAAIGNRGVTAPTRPQYPAAFATEGLCVAVGASDAWDRRAAFSSYGPGLDLLAPGLDIWTTGLTYPNGFGASTRGYLDASGTSLAAPFVTGTIGLMAARCPRLADTDFQQLLRASAHDLGTPGPDAETGWGRLDAGAALRALPSDLGVWHDEVIAVARFPGTPGTLTVATDSFGSFDRGTWWSGRIAERVEVAATIAVPDSVDDSACVWPRVGGTMALRGDFHLPHYAPWAEVAARDGRQITLRGYLYHVLDAPDSLEAWLPLPPDEARIGFTVLGRVRRPALLGVAGARGSPAALRVSPNPARGAARVTGPAGARFELLDVAGRLVRRGALDSRGAFDWDLRDAAGGRLPSGLYFLIGADQVTRPAVRVVLLD